MRGSRRKESVTEAVRPKPASGETGNPGKGNGDRQNPLRVVHNAAEIVRAVDREKVTGRVMGTVHATGTDRVSVLGAVRARGRAPAIAFCLLQRQRTLSSRS